MASLISKVVLAGLLLSTALQGSVIRNAYVEHESRDWLAAGYVKKGGVDGSLVVPVRLHVTQSNLDAGRDLFMDISDPKSPRFGEHLSQAQVQDFFKPSQNTINSVRDWIVESMTTGQFRLPHHNQWFEFQTSISNLEHMLKTKFHFYETSDKEGLSIGCDRYFIPVALQDHVDYISPGVVPWFVKSRSSMKRKREPSRAVENLGPIPEHQPRDISAVNQACLQNQAFTPTCIQQLYNVTDTVPSGTKTSVGIYNNYKEIYQGPSLQSFFQTYVPSIPPSTRPTYISIDGAPGASYSSYIETMEADLDVQMVYPLAYPVQVVEYSADDYYYQNQLVNNFGNDPYLGLWNNFLDALGKVECFSLYDGTIAVVTNTNPDGSYCNYTAYNITGNSAIDPVYPDTHSGKGTYSGQLQCGLYTPTDVITFSYILGEAVTPVNYQMRQCNEWMKLGLQGVSIIFASGDHGVKEHAYPSGTGCLGGSQMAFGPNAPSNCPYVTSVGGTQVYANGTTSGWVGCPTNDIGGACSGGGFSNIFTTPGYQKTAVNNYLTNYPPPYKSYKVANQSTPGPKGVFNKGGRGYPDVSALAKGAVFIDGSTDYSAGTSASAPIFAGIITRINAARQAAGKSRLGFLNQIFYNNVGMFTDVTIGNNAGCGTNGFSAAPGWDPVTGLGVPNYPQMKQTLLAI